MGIIQLPKFAQPGFSDLRRKSTSPWIPDMGNVYGARLKHAYMMEDPSARDWVGDKHGTVVGASITEDGDNLDFGNDASTDRVNLGSIVSTDFLSIQQDTTIICRVSKSTTPQTSNGPRILDKSTGGNGTGGYTLAYILSTGAWVFRMNATDITGAAVLEANTVGTYNLAATWDESAGIPMLAVDGVGSDSGSGASIPSTTNTLAFGNEASRVDREWYGNIEYVYFFEGIFTEQEYSEIWANPYQVWESDPMVYFTAEAAAAGAIMNQFQSGNIGADLYNGTIL